MRTWRRGFALWAADNAFPPISRSANARELLCGLSFWSRSSGLLRTLRRDRLLSERNPYIPRLFPRRRNDLPRRLRILCHCSTASGSFVQEKRTDQVDREGENYSRGLFGRHPDQRLVVAQLE